jgi:hypothetical protein
MATERQARSLWCVGDWRGHPAGPAQGPDVLSRVHPRDQRQHNLSHCEEELQDSWFDSERPVAMRVDPAPVPVPGEAVNPDRIVDGNVVPNIEGYLDRDLLRGDIEEQRRQGITVEDDNEPLPENVVPGN